MRRSRAIAGMVLVTAAVAPAWGGVVTEWWGRGDACRHQAMTVRKLADRIFALAGAGSSVPGTSNALARLVFNNGASGRESK